MKRISLVVKRKTMNDSSHSHHSGAVMAPRLGIERTAIKLPINVIRINNTHYYIYVHTVHYVSARSSKYILRFRQFNQSTFNRRNDDLGCDTAVNIIYTAKLATQKLLPSFYGGSYVCVTRLPVVRFRFRYRN